MAYITACLIDSTCMLEGSPSPVAAAEISGDDHDGHDHDEHDDHGHGSGGSKHLGLKLGLAVAFLAMTVATSYLPLIFMWSSNYHVRHLQTPPCTVPFGSIAWAGGRRPQVDVDDADVYMHGGRG